MKKQPRRARTFAEWWQPRYRWEHRIVGVLLGFLFGALVSLALSILQSRTRVNDSVHSAEAIAAWSLADCT